MSCITFNNIDAQKPWSEYLHDQQSSGPDTFLQPLEVLSFDHMGAKYRNEGMGVMIEIPEGAVEEGMVVTIKVGIALHGPFNYPTNVHPISPVLLLCPEKEIHLLKPIKIVLPHIMDSLQEDEVMLLKAHHFNGCSFTPIKSESMMLFKQKRFNYCLFSINHFCYMCIGRDRSKSEAEKFGYDLTCVVPKVCKKSDKIFIYLSFNMEPCIKVSQTRNYH